MATVATSKVWIFQAVPSRYEILEEVPRRLGTREMGDSWMVSRHEDEMAVGQRVLLWRSGPNGGIYGSGKLVSLPYGSKDDRRIDVTFDPLLERPLLKDELKRHPILKNLSILRSARGTNFAVEPNEWVALQALMGRRQSEGQREVAVEQAASSDFNPKGVRDARQRTLASIVRRQGQPKFRKALLRIYGGRCVISGCDAEPALEAAHICSYMGSRTNNPTNGLLLRSDLHTLFDLYLLTIEPYRKQVVVAESLRGTEYFKLQGKRLQFSKGNPGIAALQHHYCEFQERKKLHK
ncbi:MAG TPA: HNH endonuclease [Candidatus Didemnitutus sp.]|nr:HNH endonuclease [Candidatus Didemnitutus sp.]